MIADEIRSLMNAQPFRPFAVSTGDGREVIVPHHDYAWLNPSANMFCIEQLDGKRHLIFTDQITRIDLDPVTHDAPPSTAQQT